MFTCLRGERRDYCGTQFPHLSSLVLHIKRQPFIRYRYYLLLLALGGYIMMPNVAYVLAEGWIKKVYVLLHVLVKATSLCRDGKLFLYKNVTFGNRQQGKHFLRVLKCIYHKSRA